MGFNNNKTVLDHIQENMLRISAFSNRYELEISKQIILINSAAIALVGNIAFNSKNINFPVSLKVIVIIIIILLLISIVTSIIQILVSFLLFKNSRDSFMKIQKTLPHIETNKQIQFANDEISKLPNHSTYIPFWVSLGAFLLAIMLASSVIIYSIWQ